MKPSMFSLSMIFLTLIPTNYGVIISSSSSLLKPSHHQQKPHRKQDGWGWSNQNPTHPAPPRLPKRDPYTLTYPKEPTHSYYSLSKLIFSSNKLLLGLSELTRGSSVKTLDFLTSLKALPVAAVGGHLHPGFVGSGGLSSGSSGLDCDSKGCHFGRNYAGLLKLLGLLVNTYQFGLYNTTSKDYPAYSLPKRHLYQKKITNLFSNGGGGWSNNRADQFGSGSQIIIAPQILQDDSKDGSLLTKGLNVPKFKEVPKEIKFD